MASNDIAIKVTADSSQFVRELNNAVALARQTTDRISNAFGSVGKGLAFVGIASSIGALFHDIKEKTTEAERAVTQLNATLRLTGASAGFTAEQLGKIGEGIKTKSIFDDEAITKATTALLRFRSVQGDAFREALQLAPDVATVLGISLPEAADKLGHAMTEPSRGLRAFKAVGLEISDQQIELATRLKESGNAAGAYAIVLEAIRKTMGGAGEADTKGLLGTTKSLSRAFDDLEKAAGKKLFGDNHAWTQGLTKIFEDLAGWLNRTKIELTDVGIELTDLTERKGTGRAGPGGVASGKINTTAADEVAATMAQATALQGQIDEKRDLQDQLRIKSRAANIGTLLAGQLSEQKHYFIRRQETYTAAYKQEELATTDFYDLERKTFKDQATAEINDLNKRYEAIATLRDQKFKGKNEFIESDESRRALFVQMTGVINQQTEVRQGLEDKILKSQNDQTAALRQQSDAYRDIAATLIEAKGTAAEAAAAAFDRAHRDTLRKISAEKGSSDPSLRAAAESAEQTIAQLREHTLQQVKLNEAEGAFSRLIAKVSDEQARIDLAVQHGDITTLDGINRKSAAALKYIDQLKRKADEMQAIADAAQPGAAGLDDLLAKIAKLRLEIDTLAASANELENTFRGIGVDALTSGLTDVITGTKSVSQAFRDMEKQIVAAITRIAAQNIAETIFGKSGVAGGVGGFFAKLFGGGGGAGIGYGSTTGDIFPVGLPYAGGTDFATAGMHLVGEHGPERVYLPRGARVTPNNAMGGHTVVQYITVMPGASTKTASQIGTDAAWSAQRALSRNG